MADRVIIVDIRRGNERIPPSELFQMAGRVARSHTSSVGYVDVVVGESEIDDVPSIFEQKDNFKIESVLGDTKEICFHLLPEVASGRVTTVEDADKWYSRSFSCFLGNIVDFNSIFDELVRLGVVVNNHGMLVITPVGMSCVRLYFSPYDVYAWRENFSTLFEFGMEEDDVPVAWALSNIPSERRPFDPTHFKHIMFDFNDQLDGLDFNYGCLPMGAIWWSALGGTHITRVSGETERIKKDYNRIHEVLLCLNQSLKWDMLDFFESIKTRINYRVSKELVPLITIPCITKNEAQELYDMGVEKKEDIVDMMGVIEGSCNQVLVEKVKRIYDGVDKI